MLGVLERQTFTGGRGSRVSSWVAIARHQQLTTVETAEIAYANWRRHQEDLPPGGRVLDIGCGSRAGTVILHHTAGARATGIDFDDPRPGFRGLIGQARHNGVERAVKTLARRILFDRRYHRRLAELYGAPLRRDIDVRRMDARAMAFADGEFDLIYSIAAFEHIDGVDRAAAEIGRVLRPGGVALIHAHLYRSPSGGHDLAWADASNPPESPPPWAHLRGAADPPHVFLNKLRAEDFLEIFARHLTVESHRYGLEGESLVTDEILHETGCSYEDLTRGWIEMRLRR